MAEAKGKTSAAYWIKFLICLLLMFCFRFINLGGGITTQGSAAIGIFVGLVLMIVWNFGLIQATCLAFAAVVCTGVYNGNTLIGQTIGSSMVVQMLFMFSICNSLLYTGAGEFIAKWLLSRKWIQGKPVIFCMMMLFVAWLSGPFMGMSGLILLYTIMDNVDDIIGIKHTDNFSMMLRMGIQATEMLGSAFLPFLGIVLAIFNGINVALAEAGIVTNYALYMLGSFVISMLFILGFIALMLFIFRDNVKPLRELDISKIEGMQDLKITKQQKCAIIFTLLAVLYTIISLVAGTTSAFGKFFSDIGLWVWAALMLSLIGIVRVEGKPVVSPDALMSKIMWGAVLACAAFSVVGGMLSNPEFGVRGWITNILGPVFTGMGFPVFLLFIIVITSVITNFFSNMATGLIIGSLVAPFCVLYCNSLGVNGTFMCLGLVQGSMFAYLTMAAAGPAPLLLAQDCFVARPGFIWKRGVPALVLGIICNYVVCLLFSFIF